MQPHAIHDDTRARTLRHRRIRVLHALGRAAFVFAACVLLACARPQPPTIQVERASIAQVSVNGMVLLLNLAVTNPNAVGVTVQSVKAKLRLGGRYDLGPVVVPHRLELPARQAVPVEVPLTLVWSDMSSLAQLAGDNRDVEYEADGSVAVGTERVNFEVPVKWRGVLRKDDLLKAAVRSLPGLLQGLSH